MAWIGYLAKYGFNKEQLKLWWKMRSKFRSTHHFCKFCGCTFNAGEIKIVDHTIPHRGDVKLFLNVNNLQLLCKKCHDTRKQSMESNAHMPEIGYDGWQK